MSEPERTSPNRRAASACPPPMRIREEIIEACRSNVEGRAKAAIRAALLPLFRLLLGASEVGEGYHWSRPSRARGARIGRFAYIGPGSDLSGPVSIGDLTMISTGVQIFGDDHVFNDATRPMRYSFPVEPRPATVIEADCWIGKGALIREGVTIRRGSVIAAGAIVTKDTEPYAIVAGTPARPLRQRFSAAEQASYDAMLYGRAGSQ